jgi:ribose/xylose/arabinose/galactoside ABC-type transport system permease subunit
MLGLVMAIAGTAMKWYGVPVPLAIVLALFSGAMLGLINGLIVTGLKVPALLATLGTLVAYRGILNQYMYGETASRFPDSVVFLGQGMVGPIPVPVIVAAVTVVLAMLAYRYTRFGRYAVAIGSNEEAAKRAGINVNFWKVSYFTLQGMLCGLAAIVYLGQLNATHPSIGTALELHIIAGTILGGTLLFGGYGSIGGMALGMYLIDVLENGLVLAGAGFFVQQIFLGILLIAAVAAQLAQRRRRELK